MSVPAAEALPGRPELVRTPACIARADVTVQDRHELNHKTPRREGQCELDLQSPYSCSTAW